MYTETGKLLEINNFYLKHRISTFQGQSGGPLMKRRGNDWYLIGVHTGGNKEHNFATRMNPEVK